MRRQFDNQIGLLFAREDTGVVPGIQQALRQRRVGRLELLQERFVQAGQSLLVIQVLKREPKPEIEMIRTGMHLKVRQAGKRGLVSPSYQLHYKRLVDCVSVREKIFFSGTNNGGATSVYITKAARLRAVSLPPNTSLPRGGSKS